MSFTKKYPSSRNNIFDKIRQNRGNSEPSPTTEQEDDVSLQPKLEEAAGVKDSEQEYLDALKELMEDGSEITSRERRMLDKIRQGLGISDERAKELEDSLLNPQLTEEEQEYLDALKELMEDGVDITPRERKMLERIRQGLGISEARAKELEAFVSPQSPSLLPITANGVTFNMVHVDGGTFTMGATAEQVSDAEDNEKPAHQVTLSSYYIGETEVTQELWQAVMGSNPSEFKGAKRPVENVSWYDCKVFIRKLNLATKRTFRLPTEAEWEYAARGGNRSRGYIFAGSNSIDEVAWCLENSGDSRLSWDEFEKAKSNNCQTHPVAQNQPNELGLYDMSGNVWELCSDYYSEEYYSNSPQINPQGPDMGQDRVRRGGCWIINAGGCRSARRCLITIGSRSKYDGLRLVLTE